MNGATLRALLSLEWHYARHNAMAVVRSPARLALWIPFAIVLAFFTVVRVGNARHPAGPTPFGSATPTGLGGAYLAMLGIAILIGAFGRMQSFRCPAEATLMSNAGVRPLAIAIWLQLRKIVLGWTRSVGGMAYLLFALPAHATGFALLRAFVATILALAVLLSLELPAFLLARGRAREVVRIASCTLVAVGIVYALAGFGGSRFRDPLVAWTHVDPGAAIDAIATGAPLALVVPLGLFAAFVAIVAARGDDALPELYAAATQRASLAERNATSKRPRFVSRPARVPPGAFALVWKDWLGFRRSFGVTLFVFGALGWAIVGALAAGASVRYHDRAMLGTFVVVEAVIVVLWAPSTAASGLANDLGKPLFWLSRSPLRARLVAWTFGRAWRGGLVVALGPLAACLVTGRPDVAALCVPLAFVGYWSLQILGVGLYAAFPNPIDTRGPLAFVRLMASLIYVLVPVVGAVAVVVAHGSPPLAVVTFAGVLALEAWGVVELSAIRFASRGATLATIARAT